MFEWAARSCFFAGGGYDSCLHTQHADLSGYVPDGPNHGRRARDTPGRVLYSAVGVSHRSERVINRVFRPQPARRGMEMIGLDYRGTHSIL